MLDAPTTHLVRRVTRASAGISCRASSYIQTHLRIRPIERGGSGALEDFDRLDVVRVEVRDTVSGDDAVDDDHRFARADREVRRATKADRGGRAGVASAGRHARARNLARQGGDR